MYMGVLEAESIENYGSGVYRKLMSVTEEPGWEAVEWEHYRTARKQLATWVICAMEDDKNPMYLWSPIYYCIKLTPSDLDIFMWYHLTIKCCLWDSQISYLWSQQMQVSNLPFAWSLVVWNLTSLFHHKRGCFGRWVVYTQQAAIWRSGKPEAVRILWVFFQSPNHPPFSEFQDSLFLIILSTPTSQKEVY